MQWSKLNQSYAHVDELRKQCVEWKHNHRRMHVVWMYWQKVWTRQAKQCIFRATNTSCVPNTQRVKESRGVISRFRFLAASDGKGRGQNRGGPCRRLVLLLQLSGRQKCGCSHPHSRNTHLQPFAYRGRERCTKRHSALRSLLLVLRDRQQI